MNKGAFFYALFKAIMGADDTTQFWIFFIIGSLIGIALLAAIPTIIAATFFKKNEEECAQIFIGSAAVLFILTVIGIFV